METTTRALLTALSGGTYRVQWRDATDSQYYQFATDTNGRHRTTMIVALAATLELAVLERMQLLTAAVSSPPAISSDYSK